MLTAPKSGKRSAVFAAVSLPSQVGPFAMTYDTSTRLKLATSYDASKYFFLNSSRFPVTLRKNGVLSGGAITGSASNTVTVASFTCYLAGVSTSISASSVTGLAAATTSGNQIVYAIGLSGSTIIKVAGTSGTASTTYSSAGGPPVVGSNVIVLGYVMRAFGAAATPATTDITLISYGGREWANKHCIKHFRPIVGRVDLYEALPLQHSGTQAAKWYWTGYHFNGNEAKIQQGKEWTLGASETRQDTNTQGSYAELSDGGKAAGSFTLTKLVNSMNPTILNQMFDPELRCDKIVKTYIDQNDKTKYYAFQAGMDADMSAGQDDALSKSVTGQVTGFIEYIDESA